MENRKGYLTTYLSNTLLILVTTLTTGSITHDGIYTLSAGLASLIIAYLDIKHPRTIKKD